MKGTKDRKSLFARVPVTVELLAGELVYLVIGEAVILIAGIIWEYSIAGAALGFFEGVVIAAGIMIHIAVSVEDSVAMYEAEALNHTRKNYIIRMAALTVILLIIIFFDLGDIIGVLFGLMSLKVAAYIQPFTHKVTQKIKSKGR